MATLDGLRERGTTGSLMFCQSFGLSLYPGVSEDELCMNKLNLRAQLI